MEQKLKEKGENISKVKEDFKNKENQRKELEEQKKRDQDADPSKKGVDTPP